MEENKEYNEIWSKEEVYDNEISPLMKKIISICKEHEIPMVASFNYEEREEIGKGRCTTSLQFDDREDSVLKEAHSHIKYYEYGHIRIKNG